MKRQLVWVLLFAACGPKASESPPDTGPEASLDGAAAPADVIEPADATVEADAAADTASALEARPASEVTPTAEDAAAAPDTAAVPETLPASVPGLSGGVLERLRRGDPGCAGISADGRLVLSIVEDAQGRQLRLADLATADRGFSEQASWRLADLPSALRDEELLGRVAGKDLDVCAEVLQAPPFEVPKTPPVTVEQTGARATATIAGNAPVGIDLARERGRWDVIGAYYAPRAGSLCLRLVSHSSATPPSDEFGLAVVGAAELGGSRCVPRPVSGKPLGDTTPPAFDPKPPEVSCVAMTADGTQAAFRVWSRATRPGQPGVPSRITWFGPSSGRSKPPRPPTPPPIDLSCMVRGCSPEQQTALTAAAAEAGIIGCAVARGAVAVDGMAAPFMYKDHLIRFQGGSGWRTVAELANAPDGATDSLWKVFQRPAGGPVFLYLGHADPDGEGASVMVLDEAKMELCAPPPEGALRAAEVRVSSARRDGGGYRYGATQLVDGDLTTSWQPDPRKSEPWVELVLDGEREVVALEIANGFQRKDGNGDLFPMNARGAQATLTFSDGTSEPVTLADKRGLVRVELAPRKTSSVRLAVSSLHAGTKWPKDLALSELRVIARPAP